MKNPRLRFPLAAWLALAGAQVAFPQVEVTRLVYLRDLVQDPSVVEVSTSSHRLGAAMTPAGDVDGDGLDDVVLEAALGPETSGSGSVVLLYGQPGLAPRVDPFEGRARVSIMDFEEAEPKAGWAMDLDLAGGADVNGDGLDDVLIGGARITYLILGSRNLPRRFSSLDVGTRVPGTRIPFQRSTLYPGDGLFHQDTSLGEDVNGDGRGEILLGDALWDGAGERGRGRVHVVFGQASFPATLSLEDMGGAVPGLVVLGTTPGEGQHGDGIGLLVETAGDVDGDGLADIGIAGNSCRRGSYLIFGSESFPPVLETLEIPGVHGVYFDRMSGRMQSMGDLNQDGFDDFTLQFNGHVAEAPDPNFDSSYDIVIVAGRARGEFDGVMEPSRLIVHDPESIAIRKGERNALCPARMELEGGGVDVDGDGRGDLLFPRDEYSVVFPEAFTTNRGLVYFLPMVRDLPRQVNVREVRSRWGFWLTGERDDRLGGGTFAATTEGIFGPVFRCGLGLLRNFDGDGRGDILLVARPLATTPERSRTYIVPVQAITDPALELTAVLPAVGHASGGDVVEVRGRGLILPETRFFLGGTEAEVVGAVNPQTILVRTPAGPPARAVDLLVERGARSAVLPGVFRYHDGPLVDVEDIAKGIVPGAELFTRLEVYYGGPAQTHQLEMIQDLNGDGIDDILIRHESSGTKSTIVFGGPHLVSRLNYVTTEHGFTFNPFALADSSMLPISGSGDVDGDGIGDLAVGTSASGVATSWLHVIYGGPDLPRDTHPAAFPRRVRIEGWPRNLHWIVRDLDGGGRDDHVTLAADGLRTSICQGAADGVWILRGEDLTGLHDVFWDALPRVHVRFRKSGRINEVRSLDANGDGRGDIAILVKFCAREGFVVLFGGEHLATAGELFVDDAFLAGGTRGFVVAGRSYSGRQSESSLGHSMAALPDMNGDGAEELLAGSPWIEGIAGGEALPGAGEAYVLGVKQALGPPDPAYATSWASDVGVTPGVVAHPDAPAAGVFCLQGSYPERHLGHAVASAGDWNGDGAPDLAIGEGIVLLEDGRGEGVPSTYIVPGSPDLLLGQTRVLARETLGDGLLIRGAGYHLAGGRDVVGGGSGTTSAASGEETS
jgi:hypothetical protein